MKAHAELKNLLKGKKIQAFVKDMCLLACLSMDGTHSCPILRV